MKFNRVTANITGRHRIAVLEGRRYFVFPARILREGVLEGSRGATLYERKDMKKFVSAWNLKPVVNYHPQDETGEYISADDPKILAKSKLGFFRNNKVIGGDQLCEVWIDVERTKKIEPRIVEYIKSGLNVELSTGLFSNFKRRRGTYNGVSYNKIAKDYAPDHLALLPDQIGACSLADGCGMFTASKATSPKRMRRVQEAIANAWKRKKVTSNCGCKKGTSMKTKKKTRKEKVNRLLSNKRSGWSKKDRKFLMELEPDVFKKIYDNAKVTSGYRDTRIHSPEHPSRRSRDSDLDSPKPKKRKRTSSKRTSGKKKKSTSNSRIAELKRKIHRLSSNESGRKRSRPLTAKEYLEKEIPPEFREMFANGLRAFAHNRRRLVDTIMGNENNRFKKKELLNERKFSIRDLKRLADLAVSSGSNDRVRNYDEEEEDVYSPFLGAAGAPMRNQSRKAEKVRPLPLPTLPELGKED